MPSPTFVRNDIDPTFSAKGSQRWATPAVRGLCGTDSALARDLSEPAPVRGPYLPFVALGVLRPACAALLLSARSGGREAVRALLARMGAYRVHPRWYLIALFLPGVLLTAGCALMRNVGHDGPVLFVPGAERLMVGAFISIGEEVGGAATRCRICSGATDRWRRAA